MVAFNKTLADVVNGIMADSPYSKPMECGDEHIDLVAMLLFEARNKLVLNEPVNVLTALNVALDVVCRLQEDVIAAKEASDSRQDDETEQNPTDGMGQG